MNEKEFLTSNSERKAWECEETNGLMATQESVCD